MTRVRKLFGRLFSPRSAVNQIADAELSGRECADLLQRADTLAKAGRLSAALECYRTCVQAYPDTLDGYLGMASVLVDLWSLDDAVSAYRKALLLAPASSTIYSALLFHSHYLCGIEPRQLFEQHRRYGEMMRRAGA